MRGLVAREGLGVLWATHLIDEIAPTTCVVVLHKGRVLYKGTVPGLLAAAGTANVREAFRTLTGTTTAEAA